MPVCSPQDLEIPIEYKSELRKMDLLLLRVTCGHSVKKIPTTIVIGLKQ